MLIEYRTDDYTKVASNLLAYPIFEEDVEKISLLEGLDKATRKIVSSLLTCKEFMPTLHQTCKIYRPTGLGSERLLLVGAGSKSEFTSMRFREIVGTAVRVARSSRCKTVAFVCRGEYPIQLTARLLTEGALYANYEADLYKTKDKDNHDIENCFLFFEKKPKNKEKEIAEGIRRGVIVGEAVNFARTLCNEPANILTPTRFVERALDACAKANLNVQVMEREEMATLGMNALLSVSRGSDQPPKMLVLRTDGALKKRGRKPLVAIVGKGITFDSGGISLKPSEKMEEMKSDMSGGAAALGAMLALGQLCPQKPVIGLIPLTENLPGGSATKPGDVVKSYLGKTIEIINTDAEGRLILADALAYAKTLGATQIMDAATLTGACVVALGHVNAGMLGTDQKTMDRLRANCNITGEGLWQLPIDDAYRKAIRSEIADMKNVGDRAGGAITAAKFLQEFVEDTPWVHLDIAGMDLDTEGRPFACKGATGFGVRSFVQLLEE